MAKYNDLDIKDWKKYSDIYTDTLWLIDKREIPEFIPEHIMEILFLKFLISC